MGRKSTICAGLTLSSEDGYTPPSMPPTLPSRKAFFLLLYGVMLFSCIYHDVRMASDWTSNLRAGELPFDAFLNDCRKQIPEHATVILHTNGDHYKAGTMLYPRPNLFCPGSDELSEDIRRHPDAWVVAFSVPFDPSHAYCKRARDLR